MVEQGALDLLAFVEEHGYPCVVKPRRGHSSIGDLNKCAFCSRFNSFLVRDCGVARADGRNWPVDKIIGFEYLWLERFRSRIFRERNDGLRRLISVLSHVPNAFRTVPRGWHLC